MNTGGETRRQPVYLQQTMPDLKDIESFQPLILKLSLVCSVNKVRVDKGMSLVALSSTPYYVASSKGINQTGVYMEGRHLFTAHRRNEGLQNPKTSFNASMAEPKTRV